MPKYTQPGKTWQYTTDFKIKAVKLSLQDGLQVEQEAEGLDSHYAVPLAPGVSRRQTTGRWSEDFRTGTICLHR